MLKSVEISNPTKPIFLSIRVVYPEKLTRDLFKKPEQYQLNGKEAWVYFKEHYGENHEETRDAALFLHCALKDERQSAHQMKASHHNH